MKAAAVAFPSKVHSSANEIADDVHEVHGEVCEPKSVASCSVPIVSGEQACASWITYYLLLPTCWADIGATWSPFG